MEQEFFGFGHDLSSVDPIEVELVGEQDLFRELLLAIRAETIPTAPPVFEVAKGSTAADVLRVWNPGIFLLSQRLCNAMLDAKLTGWQSLPVVISGMPALQYNLLQVTGRCGPIDKSRIREITVDAVRPNGMPHIEGRGLFFDASSWDGTDIFSAPFGRRVLVTSRFWEALDTLEPAASNILLTPSEQIGMGLILG